MADGHMLEWEVIERLKKAGCRVLYSMGRDLHEQVDFTVDALPQAKLRFPAEIQFTLQGGNLFKLEHYLSERRAPHDRAHFYVVVQKFMKPEQAAAKILDFLFWKYFVIPPRTGVYGVFLKQPGHWAEFDPDERLSWLKRRADPALTAEKRSLGVVVEMTDVGFFIQTSNDKRAGLKPWFAYYSDIVDKELASLLWRLRNENYNRPPEPIHVNFYRKVDRQGKKALSVLGHRA